MTFAALVSNVITGMLHEQRRDGGVGANITDQNSHIYILTWTFVPVTFHNFSLHINMFRIIELDWMKQTFASWVRFHSDLYVNIYIYIS